MTAVSTDRLYGQSSGVAVKAPVRAVATGNVSAPVGTPPTGLMTIGGVALAEGDRVLLTAQTSPIDNGIYNASVSQWARAGDFDGPYDAVNGTLIVQPLINGTGAFWQLSANNPVLPGSTPLFFGLQNNPNVTFPITPVENSLLVIPQNTSYPVGHAWRYLTALQLADVMAGTLTQDCAQALQNCIDVAWVSKCACYIPGGSYLISFGLIINHASAAADYRGDGFQIYGDGAGPVFSRIDIRTTVLYATANITLMRYQQYLGAVTTSGNYYVQRFRFEGNSSVAVVQLDVLGEYSVFERFEIFNNSTGDGIRCLEHTKGTIQLGNILNRDYATAGLGAARVGCGINVFSQYNAGLGRIFKVTSRGFKDGYVFGDGTHDLAAFSVAECECSNNYRGMTIGATMSKCKLIGNYFEGTELTAIIDTGRYSSIRDNKIEPGTWTLGIDGTGNGGGCIYDGNYIGLSPGLSGVTGMAVAGSRTAMSIVTNNTFVWGSSGTGLSNVIGLQISGQDALIKHEPNFFSPNAGWAGAANCNAFVDLTTSSSGSSGDGVQGFGLAMDATTSFPRMCRGAYGLWRNAAALGNSALSAGVLTLGPATYVVWNPSSGTPNVTSINPAVCEEGHVYKLRIVNGTGNAITLTNGANLRVGTANIVQANGTTWTYEFFMDANSAWLAAAPVQNA